MITDELYVELVAQRNVFITSSFITDALDYGK